MSLIAAALLLSSPMALAPQDKDGEARKVDVLPNPAVSQTARQWLALLDAGQWRESWEATASVFRELNTAETWADVSEQVARRWVRSCPGNGRARNGYLPRPRAMKWSSSGRVSAITRMQRKL